MTTKSIDKLIKEALDIANELCYDDKCKQELQTATNETQISNILIAARRRYYDWPWGYAMGKRIKQRHFIDVDKINNVHIVERRNKTYIIFTTKIDNKNQEIELSEEEYGRMLQNGYYDT